MMASNVWIVNSSGHKLLLIRYHCNFMLKWNFSDVEVGEPRTFTVEFSDRRIKDEKGCSGLAEFALEGTQCRFQLQAVRDHRGCYYLQADYSYMDLHSFVVFPPPMGESKTGCLGWNASNLCLVVLQRSQLGLPPSPPPVLDGIQEWMGYYSDAINELSLTEMTLPGSHNSGTYRPEIALVSAYVRCQNESITSQLKAGIRVLDIRIAQCGIEDFIISHDKWKTRYSLKQALQEVAGFIDQTSKEIVILDFHRFNNLTGDIFNHSLLKLQVREELQDRFLPFKGVFNTPLRDIWDSNPRSRVIVAWNVKEACDDDMWPGVKHEWYQGANSDSKLHSALHKTFEDDWGTRTGMWNVCAFRSTTALSSPISNAKDLRGKLSSWFHGCSEWTLKANIICTDFTQEYGNTIHAAICANLLKAKRIKQ